MQNFLEEVKKLPDSPGVYIMYNVSGSVIYVGKAKSLIHRVNSYFLGSHGQDAKIKSIKQQLDQIKYVVTNTESESLVLESNLIKKHLPRFNVLLKDDKHFPYIKVTVKDKFPAIFIVRKKIDDGAKYFGPFPQSSIVRPSLKFIGRYFPVRVCTGNVSLRKPCLNYFIKRCPGPCAGAISEGEYQQYIKEIIMFLEGKHENLKTEVEKQMRVLAGEENFERAAIYRDRLFSLQKITQKQKVILEENDNVDVIATRIVADLVHLCVMTYRGGYLLAQFNYKLALSRDDDLIEIIYQGLAQHYNSQEDWPQELLLTEELKDKKEFSEALHLFFGKIILRYPVQGDRRQLMRLAYQNVMKYTGRRHLLTPRIEKGLIELQKMLGTATRPRSIVGFDISHLGGTNTVASAVYFDEGTPEKKNYKRYSLRTLGDDPDDYRAMFEVISRYFDRYPVPDIILIDGGKGQLSVALRALADAGKMPMSILALAKKEETLFSPHKESAMKLPHTSLGLHILQRVRDEAHRFAQAYQKKKRTHQALGSGIDEISGISRARKRKLILYFGSVMAIKKATVDDIINIPGFSYALAQKIYDYFH